MNSRSVFREDFPQPAHKALTDLYVPEEELT